VKRLSTFVLLAGLTVGSCLSVQSGTNGLLLDFHAAPVESVLDYLSEAAGLIIVLQSHPRGTVDVSSAQPVTKSEALALLNSALQPNGLAAILNGRTLTIMNQDEVKAHHLPVSFGNDPERIPKTDQVITQIIPLRFIEVAQLVKDLQPLVPPQARMTANDSANSIVVSDTQANIHKLAEIIKAIDLSAEEIMARRIFRLRNADPQEMAGLLSELFPDQSSSSDNESPFEAIGPGGFPPPPAGGFGGGGPDTPGTDSAGSQNQRLKKRARVIVVADERTASVVVSAAQQLMDQIERVVTQLDLNPAGRQTVKMYQLKNAHPHELTQVLQEIFQKNSTANNNRSSTTQNDPLATRIATQSQQNSSNSRTAAASNNRSGSGGAGPSLQ